MMNHPISPMSQSILQAFQPAKLEDVWRIAKAIAGSDLAPKDYKDKPDNVVVAVMMGAEVGLSPMASVQNIAVINGRPSLWGDAALAVVRVHPEFEAIGEAYDESTAIATCTIKRRGQESITRHFGRLDAEKARLWTKEGPWQQYPRRMLQMRARSWAMRDAFPDALRGLHIAEEVQDIERDVTPPAEHAAPAQLGMAGLKAQLAKQRAEIIEVANGKTMAPQVEPPPPRVTYARLVDHMMHATDLDVLYADADLISLLPENQREEVTTIFKQCEAELKASVLKDIKIPEEGGQP